MAIEVRSSQIRDAVIRMRDSGRSALEVATWLRSAYAFDAVETEAYMLAAERIRLARTAIEIEQHRPTLAERARWSVGGINRWYRRWLAKRALV